MVIVPPVSSDRKRVSQVACTGFWLAIGLGVVVSGGQSLMAADIVALLKPKEESVARYATEFIQVRSFGVLASMISFVANGVYRGLKDTKTPFYAAVGSAVANLTLNVLFVYGKQGQGY